MAVTVPLLLGVLCSLIIAMVQPVEVSQYSGSSFRDHSPQYLPNQIEDEADYIPLSKNEDVLDYDWSPPNGELPETDLNAVESLSSYFDNGNSQRVGERIEQDGDLVETESNNDLKRALRFPKQKKTQVLCRVQRAIHHHSEAGYEFFPKSYTSYSCHPVGPTQYEGSLSTSQETCFVTGNNCITIEKEQLFLKRRQNTNCWTHFIEAVGAGCKCLQGNIIF